MSWGDLMYYYKIWFDVGIYHLWDYINFADRVGAKVIEHSNNYNLLEYVILRSPNLIDSRSFRSHNLYYSILKNHQPSNHEFANTFRLEPVND
jgi:hypothetical protein